METIIWRLDYLQRWYMANSVIRSLSVFRTEHAISWHIMRIMCDRCLVSIMVDMVEFKELFWGVPSYGMY